MPLLKNETWCTMLGHSVSQAMRHHDFGLAAFVFMPEHVHLLVFPRGPDPRIDLLLKAIKRPFSWRIKRALTRVKSSLLKRLTVRERPGVEGFRFWQEGGGYDRNLRTGPTVLAAITYIHVNPVRRGLCELFVLKSYYIYTSQIQRALNGSTD
jgi:putative transposase